VEKCLLVEHRVFDVVFLMSIGLFVWTGLQLYGQLIMVAYETTIFEVVRDRNAKECMPMARVCGNMKTFLLTGGYKITRKEDWSLQAELEERQRRQSHSQCSSHDHSHGHGDEESQALLGGGGRGRFRQGSFDLEMHKTPTPTEVQSESMSRDRSI
jgi:hypothetical protein